MAPKRGSKAAPAAAAAATPASASASSSPSAGPAASAEAELLKACDKALQNVRLGVKKSAKGVAELLDKQPCSLTYRAQSAAYLISALLEPANAKKHLAAACAVSSKGVSAEPGCLHLEVMNANAHFRRALVQNQAYITEVMEDADLAKRARLKEESNEACDAMYILMAKLDNADFSAASQYVLEQEKRIACSPPDRTSGLEYCLELKDVVERYVHAMYAASYQRNIC